MTNAGERGTKALLVVFTCLSVVGCGTVPSVRPIGKDEGAVTLSSGGPITKIYGTTMPIPYAALRYRRGLSENTDMHVGVHPTMALLANIGIDVGLTKRLIRPNGWVPSVSVEGSLYGFYHFNDLSSVRVYPEMSLIGSYERMRQGQFLYFGVQSMFQGSTPYVVAVPLAGLETPLTKSFVLNLEGKWFAPVEGSDDRAVDYSYTPLDHGALGLVIGGTYRF
jgi:hypothetical protein